jgi:hypothetical protein
MTSVTAMMTAITDESEKNRHVENEMIARKVIGHTVEPNIATKRAETVTKETKTIPKDQGIHPPLLKITVIINNT